VSQVVLEGQRIAIHAGAQGNDAVVGLHDVGFKTLLSRLGISTTWGAGERYILFTTPEPKIISFALGDVRYDAGEVSGQAGFAPYERGGEVYLPFYTLLRAVGFEPKIDGGETILQSQVEVDIQSRGQAARVLMHAGVPLAGRLIASSGNRIVYQFDGVGSTLERTRRVHAGGIDEIRIEQSGSVRAPVTRVTFVLSDGANASEMPSENNHDFQLAINGGRGRQVAAATAAPAPSPSPVETASPKSVVAVTAVDAAQSQDGFSVRIAVSGNASFEWHRLLDNRWYVDIHGATLQAPPRDETQTAPSVTSLRVHQVSGDSVRVALTLTGPKLVDVNPGADGLTLLAHNEDDDMLARSGSGSIGGNAVATAAPTSEGWKFKPAPAKTYVPTNPRLIVLDPGHGGSDAGAQRGGLSEKTLTLDISQRLRALLIVRGWQVQLTRTTDIDVYAPNDSAKEELQARVDVANNTGARLFVSVHVNSFVNDAPNGTTTYYYKTEDRQLAQAVHDRLTSANLGTKDDGIIKNNFYVVVHTAMPAILIETAFLSNPNDFALLQSSAWLQRIAKAIADGIGEYAGAPVAAGSGQR